MATQSRIAQLANIIAIKTKIVDDYLQSHAVASPSFKADGPLALAIPLSETEIIKAQYEVIACTEELNQLMKGPAEVIRGRFFYSMADVLEIHFIHRFQIAKLVPVDGGLTYEELAKATGLDIIDIKRVLRRAIVGHLFEEKDGKITHTLASRALRENQSLGYILELFTEEIWPSFAKTVEALDRFKGRRHVPEETGFAVANNTSQGMYSFLADHPSRMGRFARAMGAFAESEDFTIAVSGFDWAKVSTVVDVGGGWGPASIELVKAFPHLKCVVQDFEDVVAEGPSKLPLEVRDRISFQAHDMFQPQQTIGADVYYFRAVFHNWSDSLCIQILQAQIDALKPGSHIIINDKVSPTPSIEPPWAEKASRTMDFTMLALFGSRERSYEDWIEIIKEASPRFQINYTGPPSNIIDLVWE